jgi:hypothetical protein
MYLMTCGSFKFADQKKDWVRKPQIRKVSHLQRVRKSNKLFKSTICDLQTAYLCPVPYLTYCTVQYMVGVLLNF